MHRSSGSARRIESTRASTLARQQIMVDIGLFTIWVNAYAEETEELSQFYLDRFRDEFLPAFNAWVATKPRTNPNSPPLALRHAGVPPGGRLGWHPGCRLFPL